MQVHPFAPFTDLQLQTLGLPGPKFIFYTPFLVLGLFITLLFEKTYFFTLHSFDKICYL